MKGHTVRVYVFCVLGVLSLVSGVQAYEFAGGTGTPGDPFEIATVQQLRSIGSDPELMDQCFVLIEDIDFNAYYGDTGKYHSSVIAAQDEHAFEGLFDGSGHVIRNLRMHGGQLKQLGLFGRIGARGMVMSLAMEACEADSNRDDVGLLAGCSEGLILACSVQGYVEARYMGGLLVGHMLGGRIEGCSSQGIFAGKNRMGGLVGQMDAGEVSDCWSECRFGELNVSTSRCGGLIGQVICGTVDTSFARVNIVYDRAGTVGGLIGHNEGGLVRECLSLGTIVGDSSLGGLVGVNEGVIRSCYSLCDVTARSSAGGLIDRNEGSVLWCYARGAVQGKYVGGLIESGHGAFLSYWDTGKSGVYESAGGWGRSAQQMRQAETYKGWGFQRDWILPEGGSPRLWWEPCWGTVLKDERMVFSGGSGTPDDPYQINDADQLTALAWDADLLDQHFVLMRNISMPVADPFLHGRIGTPGASASYLPIGTKGTPFCGTLNGQGHEIINIQFHEEVTKHTGLFGCIGVSRSDPNHMGHVHDVVLSHANVLGGDQVGALAGSMTGGLVERCFAGGEVRGAESVGGLIGGVEAGVIRACCFTGTVEGERTTGGLIGYSRGQVESCYTRGQVVSHAGYAGGLIGYTNSLEGKGSPYSVVAWCYSEAEVRGQGIAGGLIGVCVESEILACYASGPLWGDSTGGIARSAHEYVALGNVWEYQGTGAETSAMGQGHSSEDMMDPETFPGWEYGAQWTLNPGVDRPRLVWEERAGPLLVNAPRTYSGGKGTRSQPYLIQTVEDLVRLGQYPQDFDTHFRLNRDLDLSEAPADLKPIGTLSWAFTGSFDGNFHTLKNLRYQDTHESHVGLFRSIKRAKDPEDWTSGLVQYLSLEDVTIKATPMTGALAASNGGTLLFCEASGSIRADDYAGGLVGINTAEGVLLGCESRVRVTLGGVRGANGSLICAGGLVALNQGELVSCGASGRVYGLHATLPGEIKPKLQISRDLGGLVGHNEGGILTDCWSRAEVEGRESVGGLVGRNEAGWLYRCSTQGHVEAVNEGGGLVGTSTGGLIQACSAGGQVSGENLGGLVSFSMDDVIENCRFQGTLSGYYIGGLICQGVGSGTLLDSYCVAKIEGVPYAGALARRLEASVLVAHCFWDQTIFSAGRNNSELTPTQKNNITGLDREMLQKGGPLNEAGWDLEGTWQLIEGDYPHLWWEL